MAFSAIIQIIPKEKKIGIDSSFFDFELDNINRVQLEFNIKELKIGKEKNIYVIKLYDDNDYYISLDSDTLKNKLE